MGEEQKSKLFWLGIIPKCPYYKSVVNIGLLIILTVLGTIGLYFLNVWVAVGFVIYAIFYYLWLNPVKVCPYCYYALKETTIENGKTSMKLMLLDEWKESCVQKHVDCGKRWSISFIVLWIGPVILITISFFVNWDIVALLSLIGYILVMIVWSIYMKRKVCPTCAIQEECQSAF